MNAQKVKDLIDQLAAATRELDEAHKLKNSADKALNEAHTRWTNLRIAFTKESEDLLDPHSIPDRIRPQQVVDR